MLRKFFIHRLIVVSVVISMLAIQAYPAMATFQQTLIHAQEQLFSVLFIPPAVYVPPAPLDIKDRVYPVENNFPVDVYQTAMPTFTPTPSATPTPSPTPTTTPTPAPTQAPSERYHATRIIDIEGTVINPDAILGPYDFVSEAEPNEAVLLGGSCVVVAFDGVITNPEQVYLWMRGVFYRGPANMANLTITYSDRVLSCEDSRWRGFPLMSSINGTQFPHGREFRGHIPAQIWFPGVVPMPPTQVRSIRLSVSGPFAPVNSVTVYKGAFAAESINGAEDPVGEDNCNDCMDSDARGQAQEEVGEPIDVNSGVYTYGNDDISTQGLVEPINFRRFFVNGTDFDEFFRSSTNTFGSGWSHNYNSRMFTYLDLRSMSEFAEKDVDMAGHHRVNDRWLALMRAVVKFVTEFNLHNDEANSGIPDLSLSDAIDLAHKLLTDSIDQEGTFARNTMWGDKLEREIKPFAVEIQPIKIFITRNNAIHTLIPDGQAVDGVQKWKFITGFTAEVESYENGIQLWHNGTPVLDGNGVPVLVESRVVLRDQTVQYYDFKGGMVAIGTVYSGTQMTIDGTVKYQSLLHPTILKYTNITDASNQVWYLLTSIEGGSNPTSVHSLNLSYEFLSMPDNKYIPRISTIQEYVGGVFPTNGRQVSYSYTPTTYPGSVFGQTFNDLRNLSLKTFTDLNGQNWQYKYVDVMAEPPTHDDHGAPVNPDEAQIPFSIYPRMAAVINPLGQVTENTTFCSYNWGVLFNTFMSSAERMDDILEARYDFETNTTKYTKGPRSCAPGRAYRQYNGAGQLTLTMNYGHRQNLPDNSVTVIDGDGIATRYTYTNGVVTQIDVLMNGRWVATEQTMYDANFRPIRKTDERGNRSEFLWDGDGENYLRETVIDPDRRTTLFPDLVTETNINDDVYNRVLVGVDAMNRVTGYSYHNDFYNLPLTISQEREILDGINTAPAYNGYITTQYVYFPKPENGNPSPFEGMLQMMRTNDGMWTCYTYNAQLQRTKVIVNCDQSNQQPKDNANITELFYDISGRLVATKTYQNATPGDFIVNAVKYDHAGNVVAVIENYTGDLVTSPIVINTGLCNTAPNATQNICTNYVYNSAGQLTSKIAPVVQNGTRPETRYEYDSAGRMIKEIVNYVGTGEYNPTFPDQNLWTRYEYDVRGNVTYTHVPTETGTRTDRMCYDGQSRLTATIQNYVPAMIAWYIDPCNTTVQLNAGTNYDKNVVTRYQYNPNVDITQIVTDPLGRRTAYCADALNRVTRIVENVNGSITRLCDPLQTTRNWLTPDKNLITDFVYDNNGNVIRSIDPLGVTTLYYYDQFNRLVAQVVNPDPNATSQTLEHSFSYLTTPDGAPSQNVITKYYYDDSGNLEAIVDSKARLTWMCYDDLNRNTHIVTNLYLPDFDTNPNYYNHLGFEGSLSHDALRWSACNNISQLASTVERNLVTTIQYDALGRVSVVTNLGDLTTSSDDQAVKTEYDALGRTVAVIESYKDGVNGGAVDEDLITTFTYDQQGNLISATAPDGLVTQYQYDLMNRQTQVSVGGLTQSTKYDILGRVKETTNPLNVSSNFYYDEVNRLNRVRDGMGFYTSYEYDVAGRMTRAISPMGYAVRYTYDLADRPVTVSSPLGLTMQSYYDMGGRLVRQIDMGGRVTHYAYDYLSRLTQATENVTGTTEASTTENIISSYKYDVVGNLLEVTAPNQAKVGYQYDSLDRQIVFDGLGGLGNWTTTYDALGRVTAIQDPNSTITTLGYDKMNRVIGINYTQPTPGVVSPTSNVSYTYDMMGRRKSMTDATTTNYIYDPLGRMTKVENLNGAVPQKSVEYGYDSLGRRTQMTMDDDLTVAGNKVVNYAYDANNRLTQVTGWDASVTTYEYDPNNRLTRMNLPTGLNTEYTYDADSRLVSSALSRAGDLTADVYAYAYDSAGLRTQVSESTYNLMSMLVPSRELQSEFARLIVGDAEILYLAPATEIPNGSLGCSADEACFAVNFVAKVTPDTGGQPVEISDWVGFKIQYQDTNPDDTQGQSLVLQAIPKNFTPNPINVSKLVYEKIAPIIYESYHNALTLIFGENYDINTIVENGFDTFLELLGANEGSYSSSSTQNISYTYDGMYRVKDATYSGSVVNNIYAYQYDKMGNRTQESVTENGGTPTVTTYGYTDFGQIATINSLPSGFVYNSAGNLVDDTIYEYKYDAANRLTDMTSANDTYDFTYNGDGDRTSQTENGTNTIDYLLDVNSPLTQVLGEFDANSDTWYLHGLDVIAQETGGAWSYFDYDALGSVRRVFDGTGTESASTIYDPFGSPIVTSTPNTVDGYTTLGFAGEQTDESGLIYLRARYMNPETGAFLTTDPVRGVVGNSMSWNPYPYAFGNPVNYTDPSGEFPWLAAMADVAVNAAMGAATGAAFDAGMQWITNALNGRDPLKCMDWDSVRWSAVEGALGSLFGDGPWSILGNFAVTMAVGVWGRGLSHEEALSDAMYGAIFDLALEGFGDKIGDFFSGGGGKPDFSGPRFIDDVGGNSRSADRMVDMNGRRGNDIVSDFKISDARLADDINGNIRLDIDFDNLQYAFEKPKFLNGIQQYGNDFNPNTVMRDGGDSLSYDAPNRINPGGCSFAPETLVSTTEGDKPIAEIEVGDTVLAYNEETGEVGEYPVTAVWSHDDDNLLTLTIDGEVIITTTDHPFYTESGEWVVAGELTVGDEIISADGTHGVVDAVVLTDGTAEVYHLTVDEAHTYFVGDGAWLVHNACPRLYRGTSATNNKAQVDVANEDGLMLSDAVLDVYIKTGGNLDAAVETAMQQHYASLNQYGSIENYVHAHHTETIINRDARTLVSFTSDSNMANHFGSGNVYEITDYSNLGFFETNSLSGNPNFRPNDINQAEDEFLIFLFAHVRPMSK